MYLNGYYDHVDNVPETDTQLLEINAIHIAFAVGTKKICKMNLKKQPSSFRYEKLFGLTQCVMTFLKKRSKCVAALDKIPMPIPAIFKFPVDGCLFAIDEDLASLYKVATSKALCVLHTWSEKNTPFKAFLSDMRFLYSTDKGHGKINFNSLTVPELCVISGSVDLLDMYLIRMKKFIIPHSGIYLQRDKVFQMSLSISKKA